MVPEGGGGAVVARRTSEGSTVLRLDNAYWMITGSLSGLSVYRSADFTAWATQPGKLLAQAPYGHHAMAVEQGCPPPCSATSPTIDRPRAGRRSTIHTARLGVRAGLLAYAPDATAEPLNAALAPRLRGGARA